MRISRGAISCWQEKRQLFMLLSPAQKDMVNSWYICSCPSWYLVPELSTFRFCNNFSRRSEFIWVAEEPPLELLFHVSLGSCFSSCLSPHRTSSISPPSPKDSRHAPYKTSDAHSLFGRAPGIPHHVQKFVEDHQGSMISLCSRDLKEARVCG